MAGALYMGEGKLYAAMLPEYKGELSTAAVGPAILFLDSKSKTTHSVDILDLTREDWVPFMRQSDIMETEVLEDAGEDRGLVKAIVRKSARQISQTVSWDVFRRDGYACCYCGDNTSPLTVDHLVLWEELGPSIQQNLLSACKRCNSKRGNTPYDKWLKDSYYLKVSKNLTADRRQANEDTLLTLDQIPRLKHKSSSR
jgi:5-methylcytosine-specific restriction endonuclease McrA